MAGIYIHIPFCKQACYYCDFHFSTNQEVEADMVNAIAHELFLQKKYLGQEAIQTIYLGGGTPSLLPDVHLKKILEVTRSNFDITNNAEITLEANPDDLTYDRLVALRNMGINRLSIGIQSFDDAVLKFLNRAHDAQNAMTSVQEARKAGFKNISIDLIYAIPGQGNEAWRKNIHQALALEPEHISSYSLTIEEKTVFGRWSAKGKLNAVDDDLAAQQLEILMNTLAEAGYDQYEVSNFGKPGFWSQHNSSYWKQEKYLGIGPSAHSYNGSSRQFNIRNNHMYLRALADDKIPFELETLTREDKINDYLLTTLRTSWGTNLKILKSEFTCDLVSEHSSYIQDLMDRGLANMEHDFLTLTRKGKFFADKIASDLFAIPS